VIFRDLGIIDYKSAWDIQENLLQENLSVKSALRTWDENAPGIDKPDTHHHLLFCEHKPVYTLGKSGHMENILISEEEMEARGIQFFKTNRGGDITFHGLQQVVGYPILDLEKYYTDIVKYLRNF
jgi:lipoyl(octanoyl) transferase